MTARGLREVSWYCEGEFRSSASSSEPSWDRSRATRSSKREIGRDLNNFFELVGFGAARVAL